MEQKPTKQRNMKSVASKSEVVTENMVLKPETVLEVKNKNTEVNATKNGKGSKAQATVAAVTVAATAVKSKKTTEPVLVATVSKAQTAQTAQTAGAQSVKGKKTPVQKAGTETKVQVAPLEVVSTPVKKATKSLKKAEVATTAVVAQVAGAKTKTKNVKAAAKVQKAKVEEAVEEPSKSLDDKLRYFKLYYNDNICGRYSGKKPKQAANKAFSSIIKDMKKTDNKEGVNIDITFTIKECTRNSFHKEYKYVGKRLLLKSPVKVTIENGDGTSKDIVYKYHNELKKAPKV